MEAADVGNILGPVSIKRPLFPGMWIPILKIRRSVRPSCLRQGDHYTGKTTSLSRDGPCCQNGLIMYSTHWDLNKVTDISSIFYRISWPHLIGSLPSHFLSLMVQNAVIRPPCGGNIKCIKYIIILTNQISTVFAHALIIGGRVNGLGVGPVILVESMAYIRKWVQPIVSCGL